MKIQARTLRNALYFLEPISYKGDGFFLCSVGESFGEVIVKDVHIRYLVFRNSVEMDFVYQMMMSKLEEISHGVN